MNVGIWLIYRWLTDQLEDSAWDCRMVLIDQLERNWKKAIVRLFAEIYCHFPGRTEENHDNPQNNRFSNLNLNLLSTVACRQFLRNIAVQNSFHEGGFLETDSARNTFTCEQEFNKGFHDNRHFHGYRKTI
jgi:hypothetical protein